MKKHFFFFFAFPKFQLNILHCEKKLTLIAYVFPKLHTVKDVVRKTSKQYA